MRDLSLIILWLMLNLIMAVKQSLGTRKFNQHIESLLMLKL